MLDLLLHAKAKRYRDWVLLLLIFWHGLRASEAIGLTAENFAGGRLTLQRLKRSRRTIQPFVSSRLPLLNERVAIEAWIEKHKRLHGTAAADRLFPISRIQLYRLMCRYGRAAGLPPHLCCPRALRRTRIAIAIRESGIEGAQECVGHRSAWGVSLVLKGEKYRHR